jgi:hypothetical protein
LPPEDALASLGHRRRRNVERAGKGSLDAAFGFEAREARFHRVDDPFDRFACNVTDIDAEIDAAGNDVRRVRPGVDPADRRDRRSLVVSVVTGVAVVVSVAFGVHIDVRLGVLVGVGIGLGVGVSAVGFVSRTLISIGVDADPGGAPACPLDVGDQLACGRERVGSRSH